MGYKVHMLVLKEVLMERDVTEEGHHQKAQCSVQGPACDQAVASIKRSSKVCLQRPKVEREKGGSVFEESKIWEK